MASPVRIYLSVIVAENQWEHFVFREMSLLREHWENNLPEWQLSILHVGYDRPEYPTEALLEVVSDIDRPVFLTEAARWALPSLYANCADNAISTCSLPNREGDCPIYVARNGWGYEIEGYETDFVLQESPHANHTVAIKAELEGWLKTLSEVKPELTATLARAGIYTEEDYLIIRGDLERECRDEIDSYRFDELLPTIDMTDPFAIIKIAPYWLLNIEVKRLDFTVRLQNVFYNENINIVGDLADLSIPRLMELPNFGRKSLADLAKGLLFAYDRRDHFAEMKAAPTSQNLISHLSETIASLPEQAKAIVSARLGASGNRPLILQELGDIYGLTRERIRQIEKKYLLKIVEKAIWLDVFKDKLDKLVTDRTEPLFVSMLEIEDTWFAGFGDKLAYLATVISRFADGHANIIQFEDQFIICKLGQEQFDALLIELRQYFSDAISVTPSREEIIGYIKSKCFGYGAPELSDMVWNALSEGLHFAQRTDGHEVLVGIGRSVERRMEVVLEEAEGPLHYSEIHRRMAAQTEKNVDIRRVQASLNASPQAFLFDRGTYGLERHIPFTAQQANEILRTAEEIILEFAEQRQWHAVEIVRMLSERNSEYVANLDEYNLSIILTRSEKVVSLGRLVWVSKHQENLSSNDRIRAEDALISILETEGRPLSATELVEKVSVYRVIRPNMQINPTKDLVRVSPHTWGLAKRDLPIPKSACDQLLDSLRSHMMKTNAGIHISEVVGIFRQSSDDPIADFDPYFVLSLCATDDRFRVAMGHLIGLSEWEGPRRHNISSGFQATLDQLSAPTSADDIHAALEALLGRKVDKRFVSAALCRSAYFDRDTGLWYKIEETSRIAERDTSSEPQLSTEGESRMASSA